MASPHDLFTRTTQRTVVEAQIVVDHARRGESLHGALASTGPAWAGSPTAYVDALPTFSRHFRVIAPDTRGSGATVHPGGPAGFELLAGDVLALIEGLGLDRPFVAGFSEGGAIATLVAIHRPERGTRARQPCRV